MLYNKPGFLHNKPGFCKKICICDKPDLLHNKPGFLHNKPVFTKLHIFVTNPVCYITNLSSHQFCSLQRNFFLVCHNSISIRRENSFLLVRTCPSKPKTIIYRVTCLYRLYICENLVCYITNLEFHITNPVFTNIHIYIYIFVTNPVCYITNLSPHQFCSLQSNFLLLCHNSISIRWENSFLLVRTCPSRQKTII